MWYSVREKKHLKIKFRYTIYAILIRNEDMFLFSNVSQSYLFSLACTLFSYHADAMFYMRYQKVNIILLLEMYILQRQASVFRMATSQTCALVKTRVPKLSINIYNLIYSRQKEKNLPLIIQYTYSHCLRPARSI